MYNPIIKINNLDKNEFTQIGNENKLNRFQVRSNSPDTRDPDPHI